MLKKIRAFWLVYFLYVFVVAVPCGVLILLGADPKPLISPLVMMVGTGFVVLMGALWDLGPCEELD